MTGVEMAALENGAQPHHPQLDRNKLGKRLILAAWVVEILAAFIGVLIAVLIIVSTQQSIGSVEEARLGAAAGLMNAFLGGLPFIVVAAVELTKIPLATACYHARSRVWRVILSVGLAFLMVITFETILNGFERNFTQRTYIIKNIKKKLIYAEEEIAKKSNDIRMPTVTAPETDPQEFEKEIQQIGKNRLIELEEIDKQIQRSRITYSGQEAEALQQQKQQIESDIARIEKEYAEERKRVSDDFSEQKSQTPKVREEKRVASENEIVAIEQDLKRINQAEQKELSGIKDGGPDKSALNRELSRIEGDFAQRIANAKAAVEFERQNLEERVSNAKMELEDINELQAERIEQENISRPFTSKETIIRRVTKDFQPRVISARDRLANMESKLSGLSVAEIIGSIQTKKDQAIDEARKNYNRQSTSGEREREAIRKKFIKERKLKDQRLAKLRKDLSVLSVQTINADLLAKRDAQLGALKTRYEKHRTELTARRDKIASRLTQILKAAEDAPKPALDRLQERRAVVVERYADLRRAALTRQELKRTDQEKRAARIASLEKRVRELGELRLKYRGDISRNAEESQIYRVAALWTGKDSPADITNEELRVVSLVWFGSLALITAWTGTLLAFAGLVVQDGRGHRERTFLRSWHAVARAFRRLVVTRRRLALKPRERIVEKEVVRQVEVIKEIPVDKVVMNVFDQMPKKAEPPPPPPPPRDAGALDRSAKVIRKLFSRLSTERLFSSPTRRSFGALVLLAATIVLGTAGTYLWFGWLRQSGESIAVVKVTAEVQPSAARPAEEAARRRVEEDAWRIAEAEAKARWEAQEKVRQAAEEDARLTAEILARRKAEAEARRMAEEQARVAAIEAQRREEEDARLTVEIEARRKADEAAREAAAAAAKQKAEEKIAREADEAARKQGGEQAARQAAAGKNPQPASRAIDDFKAGVAASRRDNFDEAIARLSPAIASGKLARAQLVAAYRWRAESYAGKKQFQKAVADYSETIRLRPGDPVAYNNRGHAYNWLGQGAKALADANKAIELKPDYAYAYSNRCWAYQKLRQREKAIADCRRALALNPRLDFARKSLRRMGVKP